MLNHSLLLLFALGSAGRAPTSVQPPPGSSYTFVVLGHLRGGRAGPNPKLPEVLAKVRALKPTFVVMTGDMIWGDVERNPSDRARLLREWDHLDSAMATLGVPVFRAPGNHDISDLVSRDLYTARYGKLPQVVALGQTRLVLLSTTWTPVDGDTGKMLHLRGVDLDSTAVSWLQGELVKPGFDHTFIFMHHLLWWEAESGAWWRQVHPLLARARVDAVFSGDLGPLKFSTRNRDRVGYFQAAIETEPSVGILRDLPSSRLLSSQFDNFLEVVVDGPSVDVRVHTVAEVSSGAFTPEHYGMVNAEEPMSIATVGRGIWRRVTSPMWIAALGLLAAFAFGAGWVASDKFRRGAARSDKAGTR